MHIGLDASALPPDPVGAGQYILNLGRALARLSGDFKLTILVQPHAEALLALPADSRAQVLVLPRMHPAFRLAWEQAALPGLARRLGLDVLHSPHYTRPMRLDCRSVVTFHDMTFFLMPEVHQLTKRLFFRAAIRHSMQYADRILCVSESTRKDTLRLAGGDPARVITTPLGVGPAFQPVTDAQRLAAVRQTYRLPDQFILYVGLLEPRKNVPALIQAVARLHQSGLQTPLVIAGRKGWMYDEIFALVRSLGLENQVHFPGYVAQEDLPALYSLARLVAYPTLYEGFGLPVLEAMACGAPVVTSNVSSVPEIAADAALLTPPGDVDALASTLGQLLSDPIQAQELGQKAHQRAAAFTWERTAQLTLQAYQEALG